MSKVHFRHTNDDAQTAWEAIREMKEFTIPALHKTCGVRIDHLPQIVGRMEVAGLISINRKTKPHIHTLIKDVGRICPRLTKDGRDKPPTGQDRIWMGAKAMKEFTAKDMALVAQVDATICRNYILALVRAGYIAITKNRTGRTGHVYRFIRQKDTGPLSPSMIKGKQVYDRNKQEIVWRYDEVSEQNNGGAK